MPRIKIPDEKGWRVGRPGEFAGHIFAGRAMDLEQNRGKVGLSDSYTDVLNSDTDGDLTTPVAFVRSSADSTDRWWVNAGKLFKTTGTDPETGWTQDAIASSPTAPLYDMIDFAGDLLVPIDADISQLSSGTWTAAWWSNLTGASALQSGLPHRFLILAGGLTITDGRCINDYDGTIARDPALTLPVGFQANGGVNFQGLGFYYGLQTGGGETAIYTWDRIATEEIAKYPVGDREVLCGWVADSVYIVTKKGVIKRFNGTGFVSDWLGFETQFPTAEAQLEINAIHPNGVSVTENIVTMLVDFGTIPANERLTSGIWKFDMRTGNLYHAGGPNNTTTRDYNQGELAGVGAIKQVPATQGLYLVGAQVYTNYSDTTKYGIFTSDESATENQGYFITTKMRAENARRFYRYIFPILRRMASEDNRLRIFVRFTDSNVLPATETITWLTSSTFTTANSDIGAGDAVIILAGENAGAIAAITGISGTTVTIDRSLFASTASAKVRYMRFIELGTISNATLQNARFPIGGRSEFVQFLIEMRGTEISPLIENLLLDFEEKAI